MKKCTVVAAAVVAASSGLALAQFDAYYDGSQSRLVGGAFDVTWAAAGTYEGVAHATGDLIGSYSAGTLAYTYDGPGERGAGQYSGGTFSGFCIELQSIAGGTRTYDVVEISDAPNPAPGLGGDGYDILDQIEVKAVVAAAINLGWINEDLSATGSVSNIQLAAIQGMIWTVVFDDAVVTANYANVSAAMQDIQDRIDFMVLNGMNQNVAGLRAMLSADSQDQLYVVPLPAAAFAGLLTLGGIGGFSRLRRR